MREVFTFNNNSISSFILTGIPPPPPPPPPSSPPVSPGQGKDAAFPDVYGRAKTVRIGKWRWPPPREDAEQVTTPAPSFFEFKLMKKHQESKHNELKNEHEIILANQECIMQQRMASEQQQSTGKLTKADGQCESPETPAKEEIVLLKNKAIKSASNNNTQSNTGAATASSVSKTSPPGPPLHANGHTKFGRSASTGPGLVMDKSVDSNVGKLRISNEMKAKLEALTSDQSVKSGKPAAREKLNRSLDDIRSVTGNATSLTNGSSSGAGVKKLSEQRKSLLEQQLMGSMRIPSSPAIALASSSSSLNHTIQDKPQETTEKMQTSDADASADGLIKIEGRFAPHRRSLSRETRERKDELGPARAGPINKTGTIASTVRPEVGDQISLSENLSFFDDQSTMGRATCASVDGSTISSSYIREIKRMGVPPPPPPNSGRTNGLAKHHKAMSNGINEENHHPKYRRASQHHRSAETLSSSQNHKSQVPARPVTSCSATNGTMSPVEKRTEGVSGGEVSESSDYTIVRDNCIKYPSTTGDKHIQERSLPAVPNGTRLHPLSPSTFLTYSRVNWELRLRKEVNS